MGKVIALTGAAGYLGSILLGQLEAQPWAERIVAIDLKPVAATGRIVSYRLDVRDSATLRAIFAEHGVTHLVHAAFILAQPPDMSLEQMRSINIDGSQSVIRSAIKQNVEQVVFLSSVSVYGYQHGNPATSRLPQHIREDAPQQPNMVYGQHKAEVERFLREQGEDFMRTRIAIIRPTAIVGPRGKTVSHLKALTAQPVFLVADGGRALTQALHEEDAASLVVRVIERNVTGVFNAAPDDYASWMDIGRLSKLPVVSVPRSVLNIATRFNTVVPALRGFTREVVDLFSESLVVDNTAVRQRTGWSPRYTTCDAYTQFFSSSVTS